MVRFLTKLLAPVALLVPLAGTVAWSQTSNTLTIVSPSGRNSIGIIDHDGFAMVGLDDLAPLFQLEVREETRAGTLSLSTGEAVIILTPNQQFVSVDGRLVSLRVAPQRALNRWIVPLDFLNRVLAPVYGEPLEFRARSRLLLVGDVHVPQVSASYRTRPGSGQVTLEITPSTPYTVEQQSGKLVVAFQADGIDIVRLPRLRGDLVTGFSEIETSAAIAINVGPTFESFGVSREAAPNNGINLVIELSSATATTTTAALMPTSDALTLPTPPASLPDFSTGPPIKVVAIDPGHGGNNIGSQGSDGSLEKDITLSVARRLQNAIEKQIGLRVILTRDRDEVVDLDTRAAIANNNKADLFVSLHVNASPRPSATGAEIFHLSIDEYGAEARELMEREPPLISIVGGGSREIDLVLWEMAQIRYIDRSAQLAIIVEEELRQRIEMSPRPVQQAPFRVLAGANMPAVLVELGSISDPEEERRLTSARFQNAVVDAVVASILRFRTYLEQSESEMPSESNSQDRSSDSLQGP